MSRRRPRAKARVCFVAESSTECQSLLTARILENGDNDAFVWRRDGVSTIPRLDREPDLEPIAPALREH